MKIAPLIFFSILLSLASPSAFSNEILSKDAYKILSERTKNLEEKNNLNGWAYAISGSVLLAVSTPAFYLSSDLFEKVIYSVGQTLSVAAIGYGSYLILVDDEMVRFHKVLFSVKALTPGQRESLSREYLKQSAIAARGVRTIRMLSHGLTGALNFLNGATTTSQSELRTALFFLGSVNLVATVALIFTRNEEEKIYESLSRLNPVVTASTFGVQYRF